jgi:hypothetical protein
VRLAHACWRVIERDRQDERLDSDTLAALHDRRLIPSNAGVLERVDWLFFEDRPGLAAKFNGVLDRVVISRPAGIWRSMLAAGVRDLGRVVELHVIERQDPRPGTAVATQLAERKELLLRVIEVHARVTGDVDRCLLDRLDAFATDELVIQYSVPLDGGKRTADSEPEPSVATYVPIEEAVYYVASDGAAPWAAIARELAIALFPSLEPGGPASGFRDVLGAVSYEVAERVLDELLYPRLTHETSRDERPEDLRDLGVDEDEEEEPQSPGAMREYEPEGPDDVDGGDHEKPGSEQPGNGGPSGDQPPPPPPSRRQRQSRLRTYVVPGAAVDGPDDGTPPDAEANARRTVLEEAGIRRVVEAEVAAGWTPEVMPPFNPGFDVRSRSPIGDERLIEVKATGVVWGIQGVGLSRRQFLTSLEDGDRYWLYVVERADDDAAFRIYRIHDPGGRVSQFLFDEGWRGADAGTERPVGAADAVAADERVGAAGSR